MESQRDASKTLYHRTRRNTEETQDQKPGSQITRSTDHPITRFSMVLQSHRVEIRHCFSVFSGRHGDWPATGAQSAAAARHATGQAELPECLYSFTGRAGGT